MSGLGYPHRLVKIETGWECLTCRKTWLQLPNESCSLIQQGEHLVVSVGHGYVRCMKCDRLFNYKAWGACAGVKQYKWDPWPEGLFTEKQLREMETEAAPWGYQAGEVRGALYYSKAPDHFLKLYRLDEATPKPEPSIEWQTSIKRQSETRHRAWYCQRCDAKTGRYQKNGGLCSRCVIVVCVQRLLKESFVVFDCETTGLSLDDEILQVGLVDSSGDLLYCSYVKPVNPIIEEYGEQYGWDDEDRWQWGSKPRFTSFEINGISNLMVAAAPNFAEMWAQLAPLMSGRIVVSYNIDFDRGILDTSCLRHNQASNDSLWRCAMKAYAQYVGERYWYRGRCDQYRWHSLDEACTAMNCHGSQPHDAVGDCKRTLALMKAMAVTSISPNIVDSVLSS